MDKVQTANVLSAHQTQTQTLPDIKQVSINNKLALVMQAQSVVWTMKWFSSNKLTKNALDSILKLCFFHLKKKS